MQFKRNLLIPIVLMALVILASNILVNILINDWLTWGAITYPFAFLITDLTNRRFGAKDARTVVFAGFAVGVAASLYFADPRIAMASGTAFLVAQLIDVSVFDKLRQKQWWVAPFASSVLGSVLDTYLFFGLAFFATEVPWVQLATGDLGVKWAVALLALIPYAVIGGRKVAHANG